MPPRKPLHPIDKELLRAMRGTRIPVTSSQVAKGIGIHPLTAQKRLKILARKRLLTPEKVGNRIYFKPASDLDKKLRKIMGY